MKFCNRNNFKIKADSILKSNAHIKGVKISINAWNDICTKVISSFIRLYTNRILTKILKNTDRPRLVKLNTYSSNNFYNPVNIIIQDFVFTQIGTNLGKFILILLDNLKILFHIKIPLCNKEYFYLSNSNSKIWVKGTSKLEYLLSNPIVIKIDGKDLAFNFSVKKENNFDKIIVCFNDIDYPNLVEVNLIEDKYSSKLKREK